VERRLPNRPDPINALISALFNQNERAGEPVGVADVMDNRFGGFQADDAGVVYRLRRV
jgi:microcystin degradation protein MlrC